MASEYAFDLCFIRHAADSEGFYAEIEREMGRLFAAGASWYVDRQRENGLDIAVVEANGLTALSSEEDFLRFLEERMDSSCWDSLNGWRLRVIPKEDCGSCRIGKERT